MHARILVPVEGCMAKSVNGKDTGPEAMTDKN